MSRSAHPVPTGLLPLFGFALLALALPSPAGAQLLAPSRSLELIETPSFSIYYPEELAFEATRVAGFAEQVLASEIGRFGPAPKHRLPVLLTDQFPETNGSFTPFPSDRIVLEIAPFRLDEETASVSDQLQGIFAHELAHALSMSTRGFFMSLVAELLGDPIEASLLTSPPLLAEGTAILAESSKEGAARGRAWDPLSASPVRQSLVENRRLSFWEATGATGLYPFGSSAYAWGGPFAAWLEGRYGSGAMAKLYSELGYLRFPEDGLWQGAFSRAFGRDVAPLWKDFLDSMQLDRPVVTATRALVDRPGYITALTAGRIGGKETTIWFDGSEGAVLALFEGEGRPRRLFDADGHVNRLDLSSDGRFLLISTAGGEGGFPRLLIRIWDLAGGRFTARLVRDVREAVWAAEAGDEGQGALVAIETSGMRTDLVRIDGDSKRVLLRGSPSRYYGSPVVLEDGSVAALALDEGRSLLIRYGADGVSALLPAAPLDHLRFLSGRGDELLLGFASTRGLYRLAKLRGVTGEGPLRLSIEDAEISGGVRSATRRGASEEEGGISYIAAFSDGEYPADYPLSIPALALREVAASWLRLDPSFGKTVADSANPAATSAEAGSARAAPLLPLGLTSYRYPIFSSLPASVGLVVQGSDLSERLAWQLDAEYAWVVQAANLGLGVNLRLAPLSIGIDAMDRFSQGVDAEWYRRTRADLKLSGFFPSFPLRRGLGLEIDLAAGGLAQVAPGAAYAGAFFSQNLGTRIGLSWKDSHAAYFPPFEKRGFEAGLSGDAEWRSAGTVLPAMAAEAGLDAFAPLLGLHARLDLAASPDGSLRLGPGGRFFRGDGPSLLDAGYTIYNEYSGIGAGGDWYASADLGARLFSLEIMRRIPVVGLYARRAVATAGARGALVGFFAGGAAPLGLSSLYADLTLEVAPLLGLASRSGIAAGAELSYALDARYLASPWRIDILVKAGQ